MAEIPATVLLSYIEGRRIGSCKGHCVSRFGDTRYAFFGTLEEAVDFCARGSLREDRRAGLVVGDNRVVPVDILLLDGTMYRSIDCWQGMVENRTKVLRAEMEAELKKDFEEMKKKNEVLVRESKMNQYLKLKTELGL
jgi:hypothetical protein